MIEAKYIISDVETDDLPQFEAPEICFLGRSNSGKSSLINRIFSRRKLAQVSSTPGKTKKFNLFECALDKKTFYTCDLPGFGYAKFSKSERELWRSRIIKYLSSRKNLKLVFLLLDCKRAPEEDELFLQEYIYELGLNLIVIATKVDRLNQSEKSKMLKNFSKNFGLDQTDIIYAGEGISIESIIKRISTLILE